MFNHTNNSVNGHHQSGKFVRVHFNKSQNLQNLHNDILSKMPLENRHQVKNFMGVWDIKNGIEDNVHTFSAIVHLDTLSFFENAVNEIGGKIVTTEDGWNMPYVMSRPIGLENSALDSFLIESSGNFICGIKLYYNSLNEENRKLFIEEFIY